MQSDAGGLSAAWVSALLIAGGYLMGSIPTSYFAGKWLRGRDLRRYGSGTVSGSMVYEHAARWAVVPVGLFDIGKAALPALLAQAWNLGIPVSAAAGLAGVIGHNWPVFLGFTGGRGLGCFMGVLLVIFPWGFPWMLGFLGVGWLLGDSAPWALASLTTLPVLPFLLGARQAQSPLVLGGATGAMLVLVLAKRLEANRRPLPPPGKHRREVLYRRFFFDRDIADHSAWISRVPEEAGPS